MILQEYELGGETPLFTEEDVQQAIGAVLRDNPDVELDQHWNGVGCRGLSVGCRYKEPTS